MLTIRDSCFRIRVAHGRRASRLPRDQQDGKPSSSAELAQVVEHATENRGVASSILALGTTERWWSRHRAEVAQLVEHHLAKVRVAGSSPVFRSIFLPGMRRGSLEVTARCPFV